MSDNSRGGSLRILFADDETHLRELMQMELPRLGHDRYTTAAFLHSRSRRRPQSRHAIRPGRQRLHALEHCSTAAHDPADTGPDQTGQGSLPTVNRSVVTISLYAAIKILKTKVSPSGHVYALTSPSGLLSRISLYPVVTHNAFSQRFPSFPGSYRHLPNSPDCQDCPMRSGCKTPQKQFRYPG